MNALIIVFFAHIVKLFLLLQAFIFALTKARARPASECCPASRPGPGITGGLC